MSKFNKFTVPAPRRMPVIILADISGSMSVDGKIGTLNRAIADNPNIELILEGENIKVRSLNGQCFWLTSEGSQEVEREVRDRWLRFPAQSGQYGSWRLHFGNLDNSHRLATFNLVRGVNV